jgi:hypothetical protein
MVSLSSATARLLGYVGEGEEDKSLEMSGRKGIGVKADDLMDQLFAKSREEIAKRNRDLNDAELDGLAHRIATAALRFFMVKATTNRVIAFDFDEALSFEGESGPYLQYSMVRDQAIRRKLRAAGLADEVVVADATDPLAVAAAVPEPADLTVVCVDAPGAEHGAILATADGGTVVFFSMATSFPAAALGAEGMAADVTMLIGNGYTPGHAELALDLYRSTPGVRALIDPRVA